MKKCIRRSKKSIGVIFRTSCSFTLIFGLIEILKRCNWSLVILFCYLPKFDELAERLCILLKSANLYSNILISITRVYCGFALAFFVALPLAILIVENKILNYLLFPFIELVRPIPNAAWVPLSVLIFKSVDGSVLFITFIGAFFPILINSIEGLENVDANYLRIAKSFHVSKLSYILDVKVPAAGANIYTGVLLGMSGAWLGVVVAEMLNGESGLGYMTWVNYTLLDISGVVICMFVIGFLGAVSSILIRYVYKYVRRRDLRDGKMC